MHGQQVAVQDAGITHAHALHAQQVMWARREQTRVDAVFVLDIFLGQDRAAGGDAPDQR